MRFSYRKERSRWLWRAEGIKGCFSTDRNGDGIYFTRGNRITEIVPKSEFTVAHLVDMAAKNKIRRYMNELVLPEFLLQPDEKAG